MAAELPSATPQRRSVEVHWITVGVLAVIGALALPFSGQVFTSTPNVTLPIVTSTGTFASLIAFLLVHMFLSTGRLRTLCVAIAFGVYGVTNFIYRTALEHESRQHAHPHATAAATQLWLARDFWLAFIIVCAFAVPRFANCIVWGATYRRRIAFASAFIVFPISSVNLVAFISSNQRSMDAVLADAPVSWVRTLPGLSLVAPDSAASDIAGAGIAVWVGVLIAVGIWLTIRRTRDGHTLDKWAIPALVAAELDVVLTYAGRHLDALGWNIGLVVTFVVTVTILLALLDEILRSYRKSESDKEYLEVETMALLQATREATEREHRLRRLIKNAADPYVAIDRGGDVTAWNEKAAELFGVSVSDAIGNHFVDIIMSDAGATELNSLIEESWDDDQRVDGVSAELFIVSNDQRHVTLEANIWVDESEDDPHMSFFFRDITTRKEAEERLQAAIREQHEAILRLQELDRKKDHFVSSVSHELRSPLTSTLGYLELLLEDDTQELTEEQRHMVETAERNARRLFSLIENLLTLSRIENDSFDIRFNTVDLCTVIQAAINRFSALASERSIVLSYESGFDLGACPGDRDQVERALSNVISNAVKFTPAGGRVDVVAEVHAEKVAIVVTDNGIGIPVEEQAQLFRRFFRSSISTEQQHQGAGLGLTIAKAIIERHDGDIFVESRLGKGTTVTILLPALFAPPGGKPAQSASTD